MKIIEAVKIRIEYKDGDDILVALDNVDFHINESELVAIVGPSGCGKTTLINAIGLLLNVKSGEISIEGKNVTKLNEKNKSKLRNSFFGYLTQEFSLVEEDSVFSNIRVPLLYSSNRLSKKKQRDLVKEYLEQLNLSRIIDKKVKNLSGGQRQRVALIRAIINNPKVIVADEPTGSLDSETSKEIFNLLRGLVQEGVSILMVTHNLELANQCDRIISMFDGKIRL
jgi:putative ABC transport system ATP-binding protein